MRRDSSLLLLVVLFVLGSAKRASAQPEPGPIVNPVPWSDEEMAAFIATVQGAGIDPALALSVYNLESSLDPHALNASSLAQGLVQFLPATLRALGYKGDASLFHTLGVLEQMPMTGAWLRAQVSSLGSVPTSAAKLLHLNLYPSTARAGLVFSRAGDPKAYAANAGLDQGAKGYVDENDLAAALGRTDQRAHYQDALAQMRRILTQGA